MKIKTRKKRTDHWKNIRARGPIWFIGIFGVVGWGLPMATIMTLVFYLAHRSVGSPSGVNWHDTLIRNFTVYPAGGLFFGLFSWIVTEMIYKKTKTIEQKTGENASRPTA